MGGSAVMAESLAGYMDVVKERITTVKKTIESLQKPAAYKEAFESFESPVLEDVPADVAENWIDQLTIKQFNEELKDVFPYIYKLVSEATKAVELGPDDLVDESALMAYAGKKKHGAEYMKKAAQAGREGASQEELGRLKDKYSKAEKNKKTKEEFELEQAFEATLGQFSDHVCEECGNPSWTTLGMTEDEIEEAEKKGLYYYVNKRKKAGTSRSKNHPDAPSDQDWKDAAKTAKKESTEEETNEEKKKGSHGKVCWKGYRRGEGNDCHRVVRDDLEEAYIKTRDDAVEALARLRGIGKKIETGRETYDGNLANEYVSDVYDVYNWMDARLGISGMNEPKLKAVLDDVMQLRGEAKKLETKPGSGENARFGNQIVNALYPLIVYIRDVMEEPKDEGNAYSGAIAQAKKDGKKPGDKIKGPDGDEITLEKDDKTPLGEFILSYYDRETGKFPKGETAVLTMVEKDYGEQFIEPAKAFIESIHQTFEQYQMRTQPQQLDTEEFDRMKELAGLR